MFPASCASYDTKGAAKTGRLLRVQVGGKVCAMLQFWGPVQGCNYSHHCSWNQPRLLWPYLEFERS